VGAVCVGCGGVKTIGTPGAAGLAGTGGGMAGGGLIGDPMDLGGMQGGGTLTASPSSSGTSGRISWMELHPKETD